MTTTMGRKRVAILGSTGSIGVNALKVIEQHARLFDVVALTAYDGIDLLSAQIEKFRPRYVAAAPAQLAALRTTFPRRTKVLNADTDLEGLVAEKDIDIVLLAICGGAALKPFFNAVRQGKVVLPANKEALVMAGGMIMAEARRHHATVIPIDSEQSAIFQCLQGRGNNSVERIHLTASGGPLLNVPVSRFRSLSVEKILAHPRWSMGRKITVDSATLMNKGFEVVEARWLFDVAIDKINVVIHPEAIIHSMVEFVDGSVIAQLGITDMRLPIQYALTFPQRIPTGLTPLNFPELRSLTFASPDLEKFPCLALVGEAARQGGTAPAVLNAANEIAVDNFLVEKIRFTDIYSVVEKVVRRHKNIWRPRLDQILEADRWAREEAMGLVKRGNKSEQQYLK